MKINKKHGFTIVELVIVIAVIAVLASVLIPTFVSLITASKRSNDLSSVSNMNKLLLYSSAQVNQVTDEQKAKQILANGGFDIPFKPALDNDKLFWIPDKNTVVLYDTKTSAIVFPQDYINAENDGTWIELTAPSSATTPAPTTTPTATPTLEPESELPSDATATPTATSTATPTPAIPESDHTLLNGSDFNKAIKELAGSGQITKIVFGKASEHADKINERSVAVSTDNALNAYLNGSEIYIVTDKKIIVPKNSSSMFREMNALSSAVFENFDTSSVEDMSSMFENCTSLESIDLSVFNTSKVTKTRSMFNGCTAIKTITVKTGTNNWNVENVTAFDSVNMFSSCSHLRNYEKNNALYIPFISDIISAFVPGTTPDITYANTGDNGFLTEK